METAKREIEELLLKFKRDSESGRTKTLKEENTKKDYITPLFRALGWDVENKFTPDEVTNEDKISKGRVDYAFRLNTIPKFFLEAKAMDKGLDEVKDAEQAINYSWHKGATWAVLTDFRTLIVYNAEVKEKNLTNCRFIYLTCDQFIEQFKKLWLLSKPAFQESLLDKEAVGWGKKLRKTKVGDQLLQELMGYRTILTKNILKNNAGKKLSEQEIDETVQRIIDRLIFIRTTEDRQIEEPQLRPIIREFDQKKVGKITTQLNKVYLHFDITYDSRLFTFKEGDPSQRHLCEMLEIDNEVLQEVITGLYQSKDGLTHYDFSAIDADVLGNIYEQYLSHILRKTEKRATVESKEAHRKEQGIYYTPTFIVDYIVRNTLGEVLKRKKADEADKIKVLDMACGSGSFLLKAFDVMDVHHQKHDKEYSQTKLDLENETARITKKIKILKNNICGVDLDPKAVEIAQLNLLLKAAETRHRLPDLRENIKCGNSLISDSTVAAERAFDWNKEFAEIMKEGGFDVIVGNPPYVRQEELTEIKPYLEANYEVYQGTADLFVYFFERELKMLKDGGYFGMIVSNKWLKAGYGAPLRKFLNKFWIEQFIDFGDLQVFEGATTYPCIIIIKKINKPNSKIKVCLAKTLEFDSLESYVRKENFSFDQKNLNDAGWNFKNMETTALLEKIKQKSVPLKEYIGGDVYRGILTGHSEAFILDEQTKDQLIAEDKKSIEIIKPFLKGSEVRRYGIEYKNNYLILTKIGVDIKRYPAIFKWLSKFKEELEKRWDKGDYWYELRACDFYDLFEKPKLVYGKITTGPRFTIDLHGYLVNDSNFFIPTADKKLVAILNSKLGWFLTANICTEIRGGYQLIWKYFGNVPIAKGSSQELERLADKMLQLNEKLIALKGKQTDEKTKLEKEIVELDHKIDDLVYDLYSLSAEERKIVEEAVK